MKYSICLVIVLLVTLAGISIPVAANGQQNNCCPVAACVFTEGQNFPGQQNGQQDQQDQTNVTQQDNRRNHKNLFGGLIQFTQFKNKVLVSGFLDSEGAQPGRTVQVVDCNQLNNPNRNMINLDFTERISLLRRQYVPQLVGQCCVVTRNIPNTNNHRLLAVAKVTQVITCPNTITLSQTGNSGY